MADKAQVFDIEVKNHDYRKPITLTFVVNGLPWDLTACTARLQVRRSWPEEAIITLTTGAGLTVVDALAGKLRINGQCFSAPTPGAYVYDIEVVDALGPHTYVKGTFTVYEDIARG